MPLPRPTLRRFAPEDRPFLQAIRAAAFRPVFRSFAGIVGEPIAAIAFARADEDTLPPLLPDGETDRLRARG